MATNRELVKSEAKANGWTVIEDNTVTTYSRGVCDIEVEWVGQHVARSAILWTDSTDHTIAKRGKPIVQTREWLANTEES